MRLALIGCGLVGRKRAAGLAGSRLVCCVDRDLSRAEELAGELSARRAAGAGASPDPSIGHTAARGDRTSAAMERCQASSDWRASVARPDVDAVIVATTHDSLADITSAAVRAGKHVLVEKPGARHPEELRDLPGLAIRHRVRVRVGFNHRYHRALQHARRIVDSGELGELMFLRARYGHGGRIGYEREWRADPQVSGGGELLDQGVHLIDLARWFLGDFPQVTGHAGTYFWDMPVEDNGFMLLQTSSGKVAFLHASCTEWKNIFSFEIYGRLGKLHIEGLGGSYGVERLAWYRMLPQMGPPETTIWEYPMADNSWDLELQEFLDDIRLDREPCAGLGDAIAALTVVQRIYRQERI